MGEETLEERCRQAVMRISNDVKEIKTLLGHFIENYRSDYYSALDGIDYKKTLKDYSNKQH